MNPIDLTRLEEVAKAAINAEVVFLHPDVVMELIAEVRGLQRTVETYNECGEEIAKENDILRSENAKLREALEFYWNSLKIQNLHTATCGEQLDKNGDEECFCGAKEAYEITREALKTEGE